MRKLFNFFRGMRERVQPKRKLWVQVAIWDDYHQKYVGTKDFTVLARTRGEAENIIKDNVRLHIVNCKPVKDQHNAKG